ncbi:MAG: hypothetical protein ACI9RU_002925 [Litorivivens sp.]|jgi:hypothetical protein
MFLVAGKFLALVQELSGLLSDDQFDNRRFLGLYFFEPLTNAVQCDIGTMVIIIGPLANTIPTEYLHLLQRIQSTKKPTILRESAPNIVMNRFKSLLPQSF